MESMQTMRIAVVGAPGHGKSTFLTGMIGTLAVEEEDANLEFETSPDGLQSCTKDVSEQTFTSFQYLKKGSEVKVDEISKCRLTLIDTMGFPDPDRGAAATFYDKVVEQAVNRPDGLNALVWVLNHDRPDAEQFAKFGALMNEIKSANCKFVVVVNGKEDYTCRSFTRKYKSVSDQTKKKDSDRQNMKESCRQLLQKTGIMKEGEEVDIIASACKNEFEEEVPKFLMATLHGTISAVSNVQTFDSLKKTFESSEETYKKMAAQAAQAGAKREAEKRLAEEQELKFFRQQQEAEIRARENEQALQLAAMEKEKFAAQMELAKSEADKIKASQAAASVEITAHNNKVQQAIEVLERRKTALWSDYSYYFEFSGSRGVKALFTAGSYEVYSAAQRSNYHSEDASLNHQIAGKRKEFKEDENNPEENARLQERLNKSEQLQKDMAAQVAKQEKLRQEMETQWKVKKEKEAELASLQTNSAEKQQHLKMVEEKAKQERDSLKAQCDQAAQEFSKLAVYLEPQNAAALCDAGVHDDEPFHK